MSLNYFPFSHFPGKKQTYNVDYKYEVFINNTVYL